MTTMDFERLIKLEFLQEAKEILEAFEQKLLQFEEQPDASYLLDEMFRYAHTIKGSGMVAGLQQLGQLAHITENLMDALRSRTIPSDHKAIELMFLCLDALRQFTARLQTDLDATYDFHELEKSITRFLDRRPVEEEPATPVMEWPELHSKASRTSILRWIDDRASFQVRVFAACQERLPLTALSYIVPSNWELTRYDTVQEMAQAMQQVQPHLILIPEVLEDEDRQSVYHHMHQKQPHLPIFSFRQDGEEWVVREWGYNESRTYGHLHALLLPAKRAIRDYIDRLLFEEVLELAFRNYRNCVRLADDFEHTACSPEQKKRLRNLELAMIRIGNLCIESKQLWSIL